MRCLLAFLFALCTAVMRAYAQPISSDEGFISIDCGLPSGSSYVDEKTNIIYVSDDGYIDTGENHNISSEYQGAEQFKSGLNVRSFPTGGRNCYTISSVTEDQKYLIRGMFMYGNYDNKSQNLIRSPLVFDIYIGLDFWNQICITSATMTYTSEAIVVATVNSISVCLVNNGKGTPFISSLELRPMESSIYPGAKPNQPLFLQDRRRMGASGVLRYPDDPYDRLWWPSQDTAGWINISTTSTVTRYTEDPFEVPFAVFNKAVTTSSTSVALNFSWAAPTGWAVAPGYWLVVHFTDFQKKQPREFDIYYNGDLWDPKNKPLKTPYLLADYVSATSPYTSDNGLYNISIIATNASVLPPMLNAIEIYYQVQRDDKMTTLEDGFISIDCGLPSGSSYVDEKTNITYISDDGYIDTGENHNISPEHQGAQQFKTVLNLRSFPTGGRNCYTLSSVTKGQKYLIRGMFMYGNYDNKSQNLISSPLVFDMYIGLDFWNKLRITNATMTYTSEAIVVATVNSISVCLIDNGKGTPFISSLEMRPMESSIYPGAKPNQPLFLQDRRSMGASGILRYPDDPYDRLWWPSQDTSGWMNISTMSNVSRYSTNHVYEEPIAVLKTAVTTSSTSAALNFSWAAPTGWAVAPEYLMVLHFTDFQRKQPRELDIYYNGNLWDYPLDKPFKPPYLLAGYVNRTLPKTSYNGLYNISLIATNASALPPMLNAIEIYYQVQQDDKKTTLEDVDAMMAIKIEYEVKKNWMGDPCLPENYTWSGLKCTSQGAMWRIISLDLSHSDLQGAISDQFSMLKSLQYLNLSNNGLNGSVPNSLTYLSALLVLDLSGNHISGTIPEALCTKRALTLRYDTVNGDPCNPRSSRKKNTAVLTIVIVVPVVIVVILVSALLMFCFCRKQGTAKSRSEEHRKDHMHISDNREFTYEELIKITNNFSAFIGEGGFGPVFHGQLNDGTQVAVKMCSQTSTSGKGMPQFLAEVESLTTVHHRYLVLLVGYCTNKNHLALIYEYMPNGSLYDHLRGKNAVVQRLSWQHRARIALEAAQGLDYLHMGCVLPIVHRDVKSHNILLGRDLNAKISDFGLSKSYLSVAQSHISVTAAGTLGYIDPDNTYCPAHQGEG